MTDARSILAFVDAAVAYCSPRRVILFGSHATGTPTSDSDVDLLFVMDYRGPGHRQASRIRLHVETEFPMDILVRSPSEIEERVKLNDFFIRQITEEGIVLYDAADQRVGRQGRRRLRDRQSALRLEGEPLGPASLREISGELQHRFRDSGMTEFQLAEQLEEEKHAARAIRREISFTE